jgi:transcription elongation factor GreA
MQRNPITPSGYEALVKDLKHLKEVVRPGIVRDIEEARAHGDISENSEYEDAKERQSHCEGKIGMLENLVATADIIDVAKLPRNGRVVFGTTVVVEDVKSGNQRTWRIVGETEADVASGQISFKSPVAKAMIGKNEGDQFDVAAPGGVQKWEIVEVRYT